MSVAITATLPIEGKRTLSHRLHLLYMLALGLRLQLQIWLGRWFSQPAKPGQLPFSRDQISAPWIESALQQQYPGAQADQVYIDAIHEGTTSHNTLRVVYRDGSAHTQQPATLFYKSPESWKSRLAVGLAGLIKVEHDFFRLAAPHLDQIEIPVCHFTGYAPSRLYGAQLMNDLQGEGAQWCNADESLNFTQCQQFLQAIAHLHARFWVTTPLYNEVASQFPDNLSCGFQQGYRRSGPRDIDRGVAMTRGKELSESLAGRIDETWPAYWKVMTINTRHPVQTLIHGDLHLRNLYWTADQQPGLSDFQMVRLCHPAMDVGNFLIANLEPQDRRKWEQDLIRYYLEQLREEGIGNAPDFDDFWEMYCLQPVYYVRMWIQTLGFTAVYPDMQPASVCRQYIRRVCTAMTELETLDRLGEFSDSGGK